MSKEENGGYVLAEHEIGGIIGFWNQTSNSRYELCRIVESAVVSRCRAQGGNTSDNITQAVANKAAEEGGLPAYNPADYLKSPEALFAFLEDFKDDSDITSLHGAIGIALVALKNIARASRQVANKAEVEPVATIDTEDFDRMLTYFTVHLESRANLIAHIDQHVASRVRDALNARSHEYERRLRFIQQASHATPPATTGASTAELEAQLAECMQATHNWASRAGDADGRAAKAEEEVLSLHRQLAAEKLRADQGWQRAEAKSRECIDLRQRMAGSVGASTVLTDERIAELYKDAFGFPADDVDARFARLIEREVAAQAGQVAVPEIIEAVMAICKEQQEFYVYRNRRELAGVVSALMDRIGYEFSSPAKESK